MPFRRFVLVVLVPVFAAGCASAAPSDRAEPETLGTDTAGLRSQNSNGMALVVSRVESGVAEMAAVMGETGSFQPTSSGIPQRMAAVGAELVAIEADVVAMRDANASGSATQEQLRQSTFALDKLIDLVNQVSNDAKQKLDAIGARKEAVSIGDMFAMQTLMNQLSEMGQMSTAVVDAANQAILDMTRDVKGQ